MWAVHADPPAPVNPRWVGVAVLDENGNLLLLQMKDPDGVVNVATAWTRDFRVKHQEAFVHLRGVLSDWNGRVPPLREIEESRPVIEGQVLDETPPLP